MNVSIIAGGSGSRLFPLSRGSIPKQYIKLLDNEYTMFQLTFKRVIKLNPAEVIIICNIDHIQLLQKQIKDLNLNYFNYKIIAETIGKNTTAAIATTCLSFNKESNILVVPSDHIFDDDKFVEKVNEGLNFIELGIVVFGITPTYPETGYGYINYMNGKFIR